MLIQIETGGSGKWTWDSYVRLSERLPAPRNCYQCFVGGRCQESRKINLNVRSEGSHLMTPWCEGCHGFSDKEKKFKLSVANYETRYCWSHIYFLYIVPTWNLGIVLATIDHPPTKDIFLFVPNVQFPNTAQSKSARRLGQPFFFSEYSIAKEGHNCSTTNNFPKVLGFLFSISSSCQD